MSSFYLADRAACQPGKGNLLVYLSVCVSVCASLCLSVCLCLSCLPICLQIICIPACLSVCLFICSCVRLAVCLSVHVSHLAVVASEFKCLFHRTTTFPGGLFAMDRRWFFEVGSYDEQMEGWGGTYGILSDKISYFRSILSVPASIFRRRKSRNVISRLDVWRNTRIYSLFPGRT